MASDADVCNLALSYLGDVANVTSIAPPDGSAQAALCSRFYPIARDQLLELHQWGFATTRVALAQIANPTTSWACAYAGPTDVLNYLEVIDPLAADPLAADDYAVGIPLANTMFGVVGSNVAVASAQPFVVEKASDGSDMVLTNQPNAVLRYSAAIADSTKFSPLFTEALCRLLAAKLAGPLLKGADGRAEGAAQLKFFQAALERAVESDANQRKLNVKHTPSWIANR